MGQFEVKVDGIRQNEFLQANHWLAARSYLIILGLIVVMMISVVVTIGTAQVKNLWVFLVALVAVPLFYDFSFRRTYKKGPFADMKMDYNIDALGWRVQIGEQNAMVAWANTSRVRKTADDLLLYTYKGKGQSTSNLIPRRLLTEEQIAAIISWQREAKQKIKQKAKDDANQ